MVPLNNPLQPPVGVRFGAISRGGVRPPRLSGSVARARHAGSLGDLARDRELRWYMADWRLPRPRNGAEPVNNFETLTVGI